MKCGEGMADCNECQYKKQIDINTEDIKELQNNAHDNTLQAAIFQTEIRTQYETILKTIIKNGTAAEKMANRVMELEKKEAVNNYKTNRATGILDKLTPGKIIAFSIGIMTLIITINQLFA